MLHIWGPYFPLSFFSQPTQAFGCSKIACSTFLLQCGSVTLNIKLFLHVISILMRPKRIDIKFTDFPSKSGLKFKHEDKFLKI